MRRPLRPDSPYWRTIKDVEKSMILFALKNANGNVVEAANALGVQHAMIYRRCREFEIGPFAPGKAPTNKGFKLKKKRGSKKAKGSPNAKTASVLPRAPSVTVTVSPSNPAVPLAPAGPVTAGVQLGAPQPRPSNPDQFSFPCVGSGSRRGRRRPDEAEEADESEDDEDIEDEDDGDDDADEDGDDEDADDGDDGADGDDE